MKNIIKMLTHMVVWGTAMAIFFNNFGSQREMIVYSLGTAVLAAVCYLLRWKIKILWIFLASHLLLAIGGFALIPVVGVVGWYKVILLLMIAYSALLRFTPSMASLEKPCRAYISVLAIIYVSLFIYKGTTMAKEICFWSIIFLFLLKLLHENLEKMDNYVATRSLSAEIDEKKVKSLSTQLSLFYTGAIGALVGGIGLVSMDAIWKTIGGWLDAFIRFLVSLIPSTTTMPETKVEQVTQEGGGLLEMLQGIDNQQTLPQLPEWVDQVMMVLTVVIILAILISAIVGAIIVAYRYFYSRTKKEEGEQVVEALDDVEKVGDKKKKRFFERFQRSPARRVRKIYKKNMRKLGIKQMARFSYMSPDEQVQVLHEKGYGENTVEEVRSLYEKARYGVDIVTNAEADRMRSIM